MKLAIRYGVLAIAWLSLVGLSQGTPQRGDPLTYAGKTCNVYGFELSDPLKKRILQIEEARDYSVAISSNWDGFYAKLSIENQLLYLNELSILAEPNEFKGGIQVIPTAKPREIASWFTAELL